MGASFGVPQFIMKYALIILFVIVGHLNAEEGRLVRSYQPLDGLNSGALEISPVICVDWYGPATFPNAISFITHPNSPLSNRPESVGDLNLASRYGLKFKVLEIEDQQFVAVLDCSALKVVGKDGLTDSMLVGATLECLRRTMGDKLRTVGLELRIKPEGQEEIQKVFDAFKACPSDKPFRWQPKEP